MHTDTAGGFRVATAAADLLVAVHGRSLEFQIGDPRLAEQPVGRNVAAEGIVLSRGEGLEEAVRIGLVVITAQVAGDAGGEPQRLVGEESLGKLTAVGEAQLLAVVGAERGHLVAHGAGVLQRRIEHAPGSAGTRSAEAEAFVHGDLLRQRAGGHGQGPRGLTALGIDLDDAGGHVAVFHGGHTCDDLHGLHVGRGDVVGRDAGHAREGGVVRKPDAVHLDGGTERTASADGERLGAGEGGSARLATGQEAADVRHIHDLDVFEGRLVDGPRRRGGVAVLLGSDDGTFQPEVVQDQAHFQVRDVSVHGEVPRDGHVPEARNGEHIVAGRDVLDGEFTFRVGDRPLLRRGQDDGGEVDRLPAFLIRDRTGYGVILGPQGPGKQQRDD